MKVEVRNGEVTITGYVNAVMRDSRVMELEDGTKYVEQMQEGVFASAIQNAEEVFWKINHDKVIGSTKTGEIQLKEDRIGLYAMAKTADAMVLEAAKSGNITGWSFGFICLEDNWSFTEEAYKRRKVKEIQLTEVSLLIGLQPAYKGTSYEVRGETCRRMEHRAGEEEVLLMMNPEKPVPYYGWENKRKKLELWKVEG